MSEKRKLTEAERKAKLHEWSTTPAVNPRYKGATPAQLVRAFMRQPRNTVVKNKPSR